MNINTERRIGLWEAWKLTKRGYGIIRSLDPSFLPLSAFSAVIKAIQPLSVLYFLARILNELTGGAEARTIITWVSITIAVAFALSVIRALVDRKQRVSESIFHAKLYFLHSERYMAFDFEHVEQSQTNELLADIEAKINGNSLGIPRLYYLFPQLVTHFVGIIVASILLIGMFDTTPANTANFFTSSYTTAALGGLIILILTLTLLVRRNEDKVLAQLFDQNPKMNTFLKYYYRYVMAGVAGKDIRIYNQQPAIKAIMNYWFGSMPWNRYFDYEGKLGAAAAAGNALIGGCVYLFIGLRALAGMYAIGSVVQYVGAITSLVDNLTAFVYTCAGLKTNCQYLAQFYEFLDLPDIKYKGSLTTEKRIDNDYEIEFHNVSFKYPGTDTYALKNFDLKLRVGQRLAVVGMNGSGKTTMIKLLCRLYDPTEGEITLNGINIKKYDYAEYMNLFAVVFQDFKLFALPLGQNVAAAAQVDQERAALCLEKAGFGKRLQGFSQGLDTCLYKEFDKEGVEVSGGEAQKIALARALYKDAPIIVLDEPTAALDPIAESEVYAKFNEIVKAKTAVYISHRLSSCRFCDDIAVFHEGRLVQRGNHEQLLGEKGSKYEELWNAQAQYYQ